MMRFNFLRCIIPTIQTGSLLKLFFVAGMTFFCLFIPAFSSDSTKALSSVNDSHITKTVTVVKNEEVVNTQTGAAHSGTVTDQVKDSNDSIIKKENQTEKKAAASDDAAVRKNEAKMKKAAAKAEAAARKEEAKKKKAAVKAEAAARREEAEKKKTAAKMETATSKGTEKKKINVAQEEAAAQKDAKKKNNVIVKTETTETVEGKKSQPENTDTVNTEIKKGKVKKETPVTVDAVAHTPDTVEKNALPKETVIKTTVSSDTTILKDTTQVPDGVVKKNDAIKTDAVARKEAEKKKKATAKAEAAARKEDEKKRKATEKAEAAARKAEAKKNKAAEKNRVTFIRDSSASEENASVKHSTHFRITHPAECLGKDNLRLGCIMNYATDFSFVTPARGYSSIKTLTDNDSIENGISHLISGDFGIIYGTLENLDIMAVLPLSADIAGWGKTSMVLGDLKIGAKYITKNSAYSGMFTGGGGLSFIFPTGNAEAALFPRSMYYINTVQTSEGWYGSLLYNKVYINPILIGAIDLQKWRTSLPIQVHLNVGSVFTNHRETATFELALGIKGRFASFPSVSLEIVSQTRPFIPGRSLGNAITADPIRIIPSLAFTLPQGFDMLLAAEVGISSGKKVDRNNWYKAGYAYATKTVPSYGATISIAYNKKGVGFQRTVQTVYAASYVPGDRDNDNVPDSIDQCQSTPEDPDGFNDSDGCPDYDNDDDGLADEADGCPDFAEDRDGFEDKDGCPDYDNDRDGLADTLDACPDENGLEEFRGCQDVGLLSFTRTVATEIAFEDGSSKITTGFQALDRLCEAMIKTPKSTIEFQVHTDNQGATAANAELSQNRAETLKLYLVTKGISPGRIKALGLGSEFPIADNSTSEGRKKNQRVEVRRIE